MQAFAALQPHVGTTKLSISTQVLLGILFVTAIAVLAFAAAAASS